MTKDVINRTDGLRRQATEIIEAAYNRGYADGEADERARHKEPKEDELKPCPFCGGSASVANNGTLYYAKCDECCTEGAKMYGFYNATEAWNRRASDAAPTIIKAEE